MTGDGRAGRQLEPILKRYDKSVRRRLRKLVKSSSRLGDLLSAYPAAAFALAVGRGPAEARGEAVRLVKEGASLKRVAAALDLPVWTRRLPPEAFTEVFDRLPDSAEAAKRLSTGRPIEPDWAAQWFDWVRTVHAVAGEQAAFWAAAKAAALRPARETTRPVMALVGLYAWFSARPTLKATRAIERGFSASMSLPGAAREAAAWIDRAVRVYAYGERPTLKPGAWFTPQTIDGYRIAPRRTAFELEREGRVMNNCVGTYAGLVQNGVCLIYAIRRGGASVATMEVRAEPGRAGVGYIAQLEAPHNTRAPKKVWEAASKWLRQQGPCPLTHGGAIAAAEIDPRRWEELWAPVHETVGEPLACGLLPPVPTQAGMGRLTSVQKQLERLGA